MADIELKMLAILSYLVIQDFRKWCKTMPADKVYAFSDNRLCPVAEYIRMGVDADVLPGWVVIDGSLLVRVQDVWEITHVYRTPIYEALSKNVSYGGLVEALDAVYGDADSAEPVVLHYTVDTDGIAKSREENPSYFSKWENEDA